MTQGLGGFLSGVYGSNNGGPQNVQQNYYGGSAGASNAAQNAYQGLAATAASNPAAQADYSNALGWGGQAAGAAGAAAGQGQAAFNQGLAGYQGAAGQQGSALANLANAAAGNGPSQAGIVANQGISNAVQGQLAAAASARGGAYAQSAAQQGAQAQAAGLQAGAVGNAAALAAQQQQAAQAAYMQGSLGIGGQALTAAQAAGQQALAGGQLTATADQNMGGLAATAASNNAQLQAGQNQLNQQGALAYQGLGQNVGQMNLSAANQAQQIGAQESQQNAAQNNSNGSGLVNGLMQAGEGMAALFSDITAKTNIEPQGKAGGTPAGWREVPMQADAASTYMPPAGWQVSSPAPAGGTSPAPSPASSGGSMTAASALQFLQSLRGGGAPPSFAGQAAAAPVTAIASDEDVKGGTEDGSHVADEYLRRLAESKATFSYKDDGQQPTSTPRPHGARYGGVMAQALETTPEIGRQLVTDTARGKTLEGGANLSAALMGLGRLAERVQALEGSHGRR